MRCDRNFQIPALKAETWGQGSWRLRSHPSPGTCSSRQHGDKQLLFNFMTEKIPINTAGSISDGLKLKQVDYRGLTKEFPPNGRRRRRGEEPEWYGDILKSPRHFENWGEFKNQERKRAHSKYWGESWGCKEDCPKSWWQPTGGGDAQKALRWCLKWWWSWGGLWRR